MDLSDRLLSREETHVGLVLEKEKGGQKEGGKEEGRPNGMFPKGRGYPCQNPLCEGPLHIWRPWILLLSSVQHPYHTHVGRLLYPLLRDSCFSEEASTQEAEL